jgi:hypothetical protein
MSRGHWSDEDFIGDVYGIGPKDGHPDECGICRERRRTFARRRVALASDPGISPEVLAAQRRAIHARLGESVDRRSRWLPALAAAVVVMVGALAIERPPVPPPPAVAASDAQMFADIAALEQSSEPRAAAAVRVLFEEN